MVCRLIHDEQCFNKRFARFCFFNILMWLIEIVTWRQYYLVSHHCELPTNLRIIQDKRVIRQLYHVAVKLKWFLSQSRPISKGKHIKLHYIGNCVSIKYMQNMIGESCTSIAVEYKRQRLYISSHCTK